MSHEMRTPMNAIMGMTALMKKTVENEKREDMLDKISNASEQLMKLIDNVLDMSDIEDNKLRLSCSYFSFADMIRQITDKADPAIKSKRQTLTTYIDPTIPDFITSDRKRLTQVIMDLLDNAGKFTPEQGSIRLNAFFCGVEDETLTLRIEVIDNGMGISKEQCEKLFVPFEQGDGGIDRKFGGSGLGLAISQHIVGLMGGAIAVESEPGKGSKFFFDIKTSLTTPKAKDETPVMLKGKTALLVEDVEINREIVMAMLEDTGLQIVCAENGSEALELFTACPKKFDVILMDINMPGMDGAEATRRIRALDTPESMRVPIIAMTANVLTSEVETYFSAGMTGHIGKPMDPEKLLSTLNEYLNSL
jgi:CheY-like chemotaxis protein